MEIPFMQQQQQQRSAVIKLIELLKFDEIHIHLVFCVFRLSDDATCFLLLVAFYCAVCVVSSPQTVQGTEGMKCRA